MAEPIICNRCVFVSRDVVGNCKHVEEAIAAERQRWMQYASLLTAELRSAADLAGVHGWRSDLAEEGLRMRKVLGVTAEEIKKARDS